jgi:hypothetical protein
MTKADRAYMGFIAKLPCLCCYAEWWNACVRLPDFSADRILFFKVEALRDQFPFRQSSRTEVAHLGASTSRRGLSQRYPAKECGPLCAGHHREFKDSHHAGTATFWSKHPLLDRDGLLIMLQRIYASNPVEVTI